MATAKPRSSKRPAKAGKSLVSTKFKFNKVMVLAIAAVLSVAGAVYIYVSHASSVNILYANEVLKNGKYTYDIYSVNSDGTRNKKIISSANSSYNLAANNDHSKVAYIASADNSLYLWQGGVSTRLTTPPAGYYDSSPHFSPDGSSLDFARGNSSSGASPGALMTMNLVTHQTKRLATDAYDSGEWSPDGNSILYNGFNGSKLVFKVISANGTGKVTLYPISVSNPTWSPDGTKVLFTDFRNFAGSARIFVINPDGTGLLQIGKGFAFAKSWSAKNKIVYINRVNAPPFKYFTMNSDGSGIQQILNPPGSGTTVRDIFWSPDGSQLVALLPTTPYIGPCYATPCYNQALFTLNADGSNQKLIVDNPLDAANDGNNLISGYLWK